MSESSWFYTLSAIPQTLGSIVALTTAFVVMKLGGVNEMIESHIYHLKIILRYVGEGSLIKNLHDDIQSYTKLFPDTIKSDNLQWIKEKENGLKEAYKIIVHGPQPGSPEALNYETLDALEMV